MNQKKLETTQEFIARMTREARERKGVFDLAQAGQGKIEEIDEEKVQEVKEGKMDTKRKSGSDLKNHRRYNEEDANITIISSDGVSFKVHSFILLRAS